MNGRWRRVSRLVQVGIPTLLLASVALGAPKKNQGPTLTPQESGTLNRLQAVSPVNSKVVWASGVGGTYTLTTDGGETWTAGVVPGAETLQFRDVEGVSDKVAYLLSAGGGTDSRIYKTEDGGATWTLQFQNTDPLGFYDCFAFWNPTEGPHDGRFRERPVSGDPDAGRRDLAGHRGQPAPGAARRRVRVRGERDVRRDRGQEVGVDRHGKPHDGVPDSGHGGPGGDVERLRDPDRLQRHGSRGRFQRRLPQPRARRDRRRRFPGDGGGRQLRPIERTAGRPGSSRPTRRFRARSSG